MTVVTPAGEARRKLPPPSGLERAEDRGQQGFEEVALRRWCNTSQLLLCRHGLPT